MAELLETKSLYFYVLGAALLGIGLLLSIRVSSGLFSGRRRLPKRLELEAATEAELPRDVVEPRSVLAKKLEMLGFVEADPPARLLDTSGTKRPIFVVPYCHGGESTFFFLGIESRPRRRSQIFLHILTPLSEGRRVETSTLTVLERFPRPESAELQVVLDADSIEEIWSRHRLALSRHARAARAPVMPVQWRDFAAAAYEAWIQSAVRAHRLVLESDGRTYRIRGRPKSPV